MRLGSIETMARWAGGAGALVFLITMYAGLWRGWRQHRGRTVGQVPTARRGVFSFYLPAAVFGFGSMYALWRPLRLTLSVPQRIAALVIGVPLYFVGLGLMLLGRLALGRMYNISSFLGAELYADHQLVTTGPFAIVRHPMYLGSMLAALGGLLMYRTWTALVMAVTMPWLVLRARREEQVLAAEFGQRWQDYARRVPALIPRIRL